MGERNEPKKLNLESLKGNHPHIPLSSTIYHAAGKYSN